MSIDVVDQAGNATTHGGGALVDVFIVILLDLDDSEVAVRAS